MQQSTWLFHAFDTIHTLGIVLAGTIKLVDLRLVVSVCVPSQ